MWIDLQTLNSLALHFLNTNQRKLPYRKPLKGKITPGWFLYYAFVTFKIFSKAILDKKSLIRSFMRVTTATIRLYSSHNGTLISLRWL